MNQAQHTVESLTDEIGRLVAERQRLRIEAAPDAALEQNRRAITEAQQVLSELLIKRHRPQAAA